VPLLLAPPTWSVPDIVRTDLQTWRLAIAQRATAAAAPCTSRKTQVAPTVQPEEKRNTVRAHVGLIQAAPLKSQASLEGSFKRY